MKILLYIFFVSIFAASGCATNYDSVKMECRSDSDCGSESSCRSVSGGGAKCRRMASLVLCQRDTDCGRGEACRSTKGGGTECRLSENSNYDGIREAKRSFDESFDDAKKKCEELGFKPTTEPFANCVLKLVGNNSSSANVKKLESDFERLQKTLRAEESQRLRQDAIERLNKSYQSEESRRKQASDDLMNDRSFRQRNEREMCRSRGDQYCD
jgi:hypothetical protein